MSGDEIFFCVWMSIVIALVAAYIRIDLGGAR